MGFLHSATRAAPAVRPRAAGRLVAGGLLVLMVAAAGCRLDARGVLHELDRIDEDYRSGEIMRLLSSLGDQSRLAERVGRETEDVITEAYFAAPSDERRRDLLGVVSEVGTSSGRFIPLLLYVMQCESSYDLRSAAASCLVEVERLDPAVCAGCVALAMADVAEDAPLPHRREWAVLYLERFLTRGCGVELPGRPVLSVVPLSADGRATSEVERRPPEEVWRWWQETGRALAEQDALRPRGATGG